MFLSLHARPRAEMGAEIGQKAPNLEVSEWVQGMPTNLDAEGDNVVLVEVFQVNCPGCFAYALPAAASIHERYRGEGVRVLGVATAFEDYDKNTPENLRLLLETGGVIGDTLKALDGTPVVKGGRLAYKIPFPVGLDRLERAAPGGPGDGAVMEFIRSQVPDFDSRPETYRAQVIAQVRDYLAGKEYSARTFETYGLRGTPSSILVDRKGVLRDVSFGQDAYGERMESMIKGLAAE